MTEWTVAAKNAYADQIRAVYLRELHARLVFTVEGNPGAPATLTVPETVHYSGNLSGLLVGVAHPCTAVHDTELTREQAAQVVLDTGCGLVLVPVAAVTGFQVQTR